MAAATAAQLQVLEALADTPPRAYLQRQPSGQSLLRELYQRAAEAGLAASAAPDDIARLHALFDVALEHGLGGLVRDYLAEVCADRLLTSSDPVEAFLFDSECLRRWVQKLLAVKRGRLAGGLARGLGGALGGGAGVVSKELGHLQILQLVAEALAAQQQQQQQQGGEQSPRQAQQGGELAELAEARRLVAAARMVSWLVQAGMGFDRPAGRFFSEQEWRSVVAKRREGAAVAGVGGLFLADLTAELARQGVPEAGLAYPPPTPDRLISALFLSAPSTPAAGKSAAQAGAKGGAGGGAAAGGEAAAAASSQETGWEARLALLAYYLADGGFMQAKDVVKGLRAHFGVAPATANGWLMQQLLDDAHTGDAAGLQSLQRAAQLVPAVDGAALPHKALQVFAARGELNAALVLLRQRSATAVRLEEAAVALSVRLQNGLLGEAYCGMRQHLSAVQAAAPPAAADELLRRHAGLLVAQLLRFAATTQPSAVHAVMRLPFDGVEEQAVVGWLEAQAGGGQMEAALMLPIYFLLRGRTPEALHAYNRFCPRATATMQQQELAALLTEAARLLPAPQRGLLVQRGAAPALLPAEQAGAGGGDGLAGAIPLMGSIFSVAADVAPALLSVGPTPGEAPLVGSVAIQLERQRAAAAATAGAQQGDKQRPAAQQQQGAADAQPLLFARMPAATGPGARDGAPASGASGFGTALAAADEPMAEAAPVGASQAGAHEFDRVLGLRSAQRGGAKPKRRLGGSAYR